MDQNNKASRIEAAARWYAELQAPDAGAETWDAFRAWERDPANAAAFREIENSLALLDKMPVMQPAMTQAVPRRLGGFWLTGLAAAILVAAVGSWIVLDSTNHRPSAPVAIEYATATGERRNIKLPDGSSVELNTDSQIKVAYSDEARLVRLVRGQALFEVEPGQQAFIVEAGDTRTQALGTAFDVYVQTDGAIVTLLEGAVRVTAGEASAGTVLEPGERLVVERGVVHPAEKVDLGASLSWRSGVLQFTDVRLADAVHELNRYSTTKIVVQDDRIADERLSGSFKAGEQETFLSALDLFLPIETERSGETILVRSESD